MEIRGPKLNTSPIAAPGPAPAAPAASGGLAGDRLALQPGEDQARLRAIESAALPSLPLLKFWPAKRAAWVKEAGAVVAGAFERYQALERDGRVPPDKLEAARTRVHALAAKLAAEDPKNVRFQVLAPLAAAEQRTVRTGSEVGALPARQSGQSTEAHRASVEAWASKQREEILAARGAVASLNVMERVLVTDLGAGYAAAVLGMAENKVTEAAREKGFLELLGDLVQVGTAVAQVVAKEQGRRHSR